MKNIVKWALYVIFIDGKSSENGEQTSFIPLHFKLFNAVNVFIVELIFLYQTPTTGSTLW